MTPTRPALSPGTRREAVVALVIAGIAQFLLTTTSLLAQSETTAGTTPWEVLEPGLEMGRFSMPDRGGTAFAAISILRIDPARFELVLLNASANNDVLLTPRQWAESRELVSVINASMFQEDRLTSVSLMRNRDHTNNSYQSKDNTILAFDPTVDNLPAVKIIDRQCDEFEDWKNNYRTLIQSIRMISCKGRNVWRSGRKRSSVSAVGVDVARRVLFIHTENAMGTHELIELLMALPLEISQAMYVEGGPQAQLYVNSGGRTFELTGRLNPLFVGGSGLAWPLPNVIGVRRKP